MKFLMSAFLVFFIQSTAWAALNGEWIGWGTWTYDGSGDRCDMNLSFRESATKLERISGDFNCSVVSLTLPNESWVKQGENLMAGDKVVGTLTDNRMEMHEAYNERVTILTTIQIDGHHLDYEEVWREKDNRVLYNIKGRLFLKER